MKALIAALGAAPAKTPTPGISACAPIAVVILCHGRTGKSSHFRTPASPRWNVYGIRWNHEYLVLPVFIQRLDEVGQDFLGSLGSDLAGSGRHVSATAEF